MNRRSKQKSCYACVSGKRRCDRTLPTCTRCSDRGVQCSYPPTRERQAPAGLQAGDVADDSLSFMFSFNAQAPAPAAPELGGSTGGHAILPEDMAGSVGSMSETAGNSFSIGSTSSPAVTSLASSDAPLPQHLPAERLRWFTAPATWKLMHHYHHPDTYLNYPPQVFSDFIRSLESLLVRFHRDGHNAFIHRTLYPARAIPDCIQDAYAAIAVVQGATAKNENITDCIMHSYAIKLLAEQATLAEQPLHIVTVKDHLARTQALLIHLLLAMSSKSLARQSSAQALIEPLNRWKMEMLNTAEQEASLAQLFPCTATLALHGDGVPDVDPVPDLHRAFVICEAIRRTCLLSSVASGLYCCLRGEWTAACGGDIRFTARSGLWSAESSAAWASLACSADPLFGYTMHGEKLAKRGVRADEVDDFAHLLFGLMWGTDKVDSWIVRSKEPGFRVPQNVGPGSDG